MLPRALRATASSPQQRRAATEALRCGVSSLSHLPSDTPPSPLPLLNERPLHTRAGTTSPHPSASPSSSPASSPAPSPSTPHPETDSASNQGHPFPLYRAPPVHLSTINGAVRECEYAVRGDIVTRAGLLEAQLKKDPSSLPFPSIVYCNIGNPQALGQPAVSFFRQVLALCDHPPLLAQAQARALPHSQSAAGSGAGDGAGGTPRVDSGAGAWPLSNTAVARAERILASLPAHATGAYSHSQGMPVCRGDVARGIAARDGGHAADPETIYLTDGASPAAQMVLRLLVRGPQDGVMCPIPQYPLYSATLALLNGTLVPYYLSEGGSAGGVPGGGGQGEGVGEWGLSVGELSRQLAKADDSGVHPRAIVVINPGNPTGQVLGEEEQRGIVEFCCRHGLVLIADEVYQENVYARNRKFLSFKKVARDMGVGKEDLALVSLHSASKGFYGECGRRGGYMEVTGLPADVMEQLYKLASVTLCSNVSGQILTSLIMCPPQPGEEAYPQFQNEKEAILSALARKAEVMVDRLNAEDGITCCPSEGAMYAFPRIHLPPRALEAAQSQGVPADAFYARRMLDATGIVVVPGSGFGQQPGTWHLRFTILPAEKELPGMMDRFSRFHHDFMKEFQ